MNRRSFLKLSFGAALLLATIGGSARFLHRARRHPAEGYDVLRDQDVIFFSALFPAVIGPHPQFQLSLALRSLDRMLLASSPAMRKEVFNLADLATFAITRGPVTGVWRGWQHLQDDQIRAFLKRWQHSRVGLYRQGYQGICQLCQMAWYGVPQAWHNIGYPGPPEFLTRLRES
ncbi:twin-arginine translocation pathway signal protein [Aliidiomarina indica]|uniref:twin-arginine translocation pathway signal protein n=1 Tax=Aliidiomarina indica TaxID=2749147 RepID=UPI00188DC841|nr:twin-arginine translocation pathway signal protein [Aliidiomarina indica]